MAQGQPNCFTILREIFPYTQDQVINEIITLVDEQNPHDTFEGKIENMVNLLSGDGAQGPMPDITGQGEGRQNESYGNAPRNSYNDRLYQELVMLYPEASPDFLINYCREKPPEFYLDDAIEELAERGYDKIELDPLTIWDQLKATLPNADPSYLRKEADRLVHLSSRDLDEFVENAVDKNDYPTMQDYLKHKKEHDELSIYIQFNIEKFLEHVPNPVEKFSDPQRKLALGNDSDETDIGYALRFLYNQYRFVRKVHIDRLFKWKAKNLVQVCERLDRLGRNMRRPRELEKLGDTTNCDLLQVIGYLRNRRLIKNFLKMKDEKYRQAKEEARKFDLLETCQCCFDEELIPEECFFCMKDCVFCKECVKTGAETVIGNGGLRFACFANCDSEFSLQTLQMVLPKKLFERLTQKITSEEIRKAKVDGLETCPFCDFAMVLPQDEKIFKCINEDCMIESCRECRHKAHVPLRCNEIEYDEDVRRRTYIENKMTEALTRTCYSCNKTFIKTNGCNKMTCLCGAKMCYLCGAQVNDYSHFGTGRCQLHTNDTQVNLERILQNAQLAKNELGNVQIKFDPSVDIQNYYQGGGE